MMRWLYLSQLGFVLVLLLCSWARHLTLTVPLSIQVYKWVPVNLMLGVTLRWTSILSRGSSCCCWFNIVFSRFKFAFWSITQSSSRSSTSNFRICISSMSNRTAVNHGQSDNVSSPFLHWTNLGKYLKFVWLYIVSIKTGTRRIMRLEGMRLKRRTTRDSSSRRKVLTSCVRLYARVT